MHKTEYRYDQKLFVHELTTNELNKHSSLALLKLEFRICSKYVFSCFIFTWHQVEMQILWNGISFRFSKRKCKLIKMVFYPMTFLDGNKTIHLIGINKNMQCYPDEFVSELLISINEDPTSSISLGLYFH